MPTGSRSLALLYWSLTIVTLLAGLLVAATFWVGARGAQEDRWVEHTLAVRNQLSRVFLFVQAAESGQRGYLLTGQPMYLEPADVATRSIPSALDTLKELVADNPSQQQSVVRLRELINQKLSELKSTVDERKAGRIEAAVAIVNSDAGRRLMEGLRSVVSAMDAEEDQLLARRRGTSRRYETLLLGGVAAAFILICLAAGLGSFLTRRSFRELAFAYDRLAISNTALIEQAAQRESAEAQLRQAQKMEAIGQLSGGIAHDFNNMLGVITGSLDLMQRRIKNGDLAIERYLDAAMQAAKRSAALTHRLLAFARKQPLSPEPLDANRMIGSMSDLLRSTLGEHIHIETINAGGLWATRADSHQLENAILNIAINARDAMPDGGRLTIETANAHLDEAYAYQHADVRPGQFVMLAISDTGTGMPSDVVARVFDPFFTTKAPGAGTGLGLSQVYGFVKQSLGHVKIYSEPQNGTTVKIYLPRHYGEEPATGVLAPAPVTGGSTSEVILVVEDDELMRRLASDSLRELGYTVLSCGSGEAALAALDQAPEVALLFTDIVMPEMNGKKLSEEALRRRPNLKVLYTTGYTPNAVVHGGVLDPGVDLLSKPFTLEQLAAKVRAVLGRSTLS